MQSDNGKPRNSSSNILPMVVAAFAGATLAIACERPASRTTVEDVETVPRAQTAQEPAPAPAPVAEAPALPPRDSLTDPAISRRIKAAIAADPGMEGSDVSISIDDGAVTLVGPVKTHEQIALASAHAQRQDGVTRVDNHLLVEGK